ncbi:unnamed protein product [Ixodes persulcatus]
MLIITNCPRNPILRNNDPTTSFCPAPVDRMSEAEHSCCR